VPEDQLRRMFEQSQAFHQGELSRLADTFAAGLDRMRGATAPRLQLELMVARALIAANAAPAPAVLATTAPERPAIRGQMREAQAAAAAHTHATSSLPPSSPPAARPASFGSAAAAARALLGEPAAVAVHPADPLVAAQAPREEFVAEPEGSAQLPDATGSETEPESSNSTRAEPLGTIEQIRAAWPAILQRLLEQNRSAWLAARAVNPLALLAGGLLGIAFEHQTELEVFLSGDTQPALAGAIESVTGIAVRRYHPRPSRAGDQPRPTAELDDAPAAAAQTAPAQLVAGWPAVAGHSTGSKASGSSGGGVVAGGDAEMTFGAAGIAPLAPGLDDVPEPPEDGDFEPQSHFVDQPGAAEIPDAPEAPELPTASSAPSFTRYGEAVVREVLAATFVEELPRDPGTGR
jgi:DNA polymerase-3 subunit gamma/tau